MTKRNNSFEKRPRDFSSELHTTYKHGHNIRGCRTTEYSIWAGIRKRCLNEKDKLYPYYGGRGITIDPRWDDFSKFLEDMGNRPSKDHSVDRIDNELGYCKDNCRWATKDEQSRNKRNNIWVQGLILKDWCRMKGYRYKTVSRWLREGKTFEAIVEDGEGLWGNG